jgi:hypothetical protein
MTSTRKKVVGIAGAALCCCIAWFAFIVNYVIRHPDEPSEAAPQWFGYVCGISAIIGMVSIAVLVTSVVFGLFPGKEKMSEIVRLRHSDCDQESDKSLQPKSAAHYAWWSIATTS